ncbi:MAG: hypothetical protein ABSC06_38950 [Rhodopila sp.]|jgi:hypothetical protein
MSAAVKITQTDETPATLRALAARSRDTAQSRRLLAIAMVLEGASRLEAARQTGMDRQTLRDCVNGGEKFPRIVGQKFPTSF